MRLLSTTIRGTANLYQASNRAYWEGKLKEQYDLTIYIAAGIKEGYWIVRQIYNILRPISPKLIKSFGVQVINIKDLGPCKEKYPNHGFFDPTNKTITINSDIFIHPDQPDDFLGHDGYLSRCSQTIYHEFSHAWDAQLGDASLKPDWMSLSGWSKTYKPGLKRLLIKEEGAPNVLGEYYYDPKKMGTDGRLFTRFYAARNPWDDWADSSAFMMGKLRDKVPAKKAAYFDKLFESYL